MFFPVLPQTETIGNNKKEWPQIYELNFILETFLQTYFEAVYKTLNNEQKRKKRMSMQNIIKQLVPFSIICLSQLNATHF